jgi:2-dehydro-3-deoxygluconokinase
MPDIVAIGEPLIEFNQLPPERGGRADGRLYLKGFGGDASNAMIAAARQGAKVGFITRLGQDENAQDLRELWNREGVDHSRCADGEDASTGLYFVTHGENGHSFSFMRKNSASSLVTEADVPEDYIQSAKILHVTGISLAISDTARAACFKAIAIARAAGIKVSVDTNLRLRLWPIEIARDVITQAIDQCDIALPSLDDITHISGLSDPDEIIAWCHARGPQVVALKLGAEGALVSDGSARHRIAPFPCKPVDATGAGDAYGGAFLARLLAGDDAHRAGRYAAACAALSTQGYGAVEPIPSAQLVVSALDKQA